MLQLDNWQSLLATVAAVGILFFVANRLGALLSGDLQSAHLNTIVGLNSLALIGLLLGQFAQPIPVFLVGAIFVVFLVTWAIHRVTVRHFSINVSLPLQNFSIVAFLALIFTLGPALTYPAGWDELTYHMTLPSRWALAGSIDIQTDLPYSALPSLSEIVFWIVQPIEQLITPRLTGWLVWAVGIWLFKETIDRFCKPVNSLLLTGVLSASPIVLMISANCFVEAFIWSDTAALCYLLLRRESDQGHPGRQALLVGIIAGGALATKMTSVGLVLIPVLLWKPSRDRRTMAWRFILASLSISGLFALPFYVRPWLQSGNPFGPFFASWFSSDPSVLQTSIYHHDLAAGNFGLHGIFGLIAGPLAIAFANELYDGMFGWQWIILLGLAGVAVFQAGSPLQQKFAARPIFAAAIGLYLIWILTAQQARFAISLFMLVTILAAIGLENVSPKKQRAIKLTLIATAAVSLPWTNVGYYVDSWLCVLRIRMPADYIRDGVGDSYAELAIHLKTIAKPENKIVSLFEHRLAYLPRGIEIATPYFQSKYFVAPTANRSSQSILQELHRHKITHVILPSNPLGPDVSSLFIDLQQQWFQGVDECISTGQFKIIWKSEQHAIAEVVAQP